jgi:hypothetical protein
MADGQNAPNAFQQNAFARAAVLQNGVDRIQQIYANTVNGSTSPVVNISPRNVGLIKGFFVDIEATLTVGATDPAAITKFGPANILRQIQFIDLQNNTRIQTTGWHLHFINTARAQRPFGLADTLESSPIDYGNNWDVISAPAAPAALATATVKMRYYVPLAYSNDDLRGAVYANVVNATMNLQLTINSSPFVATGDATAAVYSGNSGTIGDVTVTVYQHYIDQLPVGQGGTPILPILDLSTIYELKNTTLTGMAANQDYPIPYANFRSFLSTFAVYDNGGTLNVGTDINYWAQQSANFTNIFKLTAVETALLTRIRNGTDYPAGVYYFDHRRRPLNTIQYGNIELVLNASSVGANSAILAGFESFAMINVISGAGSLPAGG